MIGRLLAMILRHCFARWREPGTVRAAEDPLEGDLRDLRRRHGRGPAAGRGLRRSGLRQQRRRAGRGARRAGPSLRRCPADAAGLHEVAFAYAKSPLAELGERWEGTKVAGHPVIPSLLIDEQGVVQGIRIVTDPDGPDVSEKEGVPARHPGHGPLRPRRLDLHRGRAGRRPKPGRRHVHRPPLREDLPRPPPDPQHRSLPHRRSSRARSSPTRPGSKSSSSRAEAGVSRSPPRQRPRPALRAEDRRTSGGLICRLRDLQAASTNA